MDACQNGRKIHFGGHLYILPGAQEAPSMAGIRFYRKPQKWSGILEYILPGAQTRLKPTSWPWKKTQKKSADPPFGKPLRATSAEKP